MMDLLTRADAIFSDDRLYRYLLMRDWGGGKSMIFVMLNPSTADAQTDDRTIGRCRSLALREGYGGILIANLYALRSRDPKKLRTAADPVGPLNPTQLTAIATIAANYGRPIICAWGDDPMTKKPGAIAGILTLQGSGAKLLCLGITKNGSPKHPLYLAGETPLEPFTPAIYHG